MKYVNFRHAARFVCSFGLLMAVISFLSAQSFELEDVMSYAFPSDLAVAPEGNAVAWVFNQEGRRNIWIAQGPEYLAQKLTAYEQDDGQEISSLTFNAEGNIIVYVRGGDANRAGEYPNPTSSPVADIDFWTSPVLFIHGDDDRNVDFVQTTDLVQRLRKLGKTHIELLIFPDEVHGFLRHDVWLEVYSTAADFFDRFLLKKHR